ncbi:MAG: hypothetical protein ACLFWM_02755 [Actinomycetota bacterium]
MAKYEVNAAAVEWVEQLIDSHQYVVRSEWSDVQPHAREGNDYLQRHGWEGYGRWHLGLTAEAREETKGRYAFVVGDFRRVHRSGLMACRFRATQWDHKAVELAAHELIQRLDRVRGIRS